MFNKKEYQDTFARVRASGETYQEVLKMADRRKTSTHTGLRRAVVLTAAVIVVMAMTVTAFAAEDIAAWFRGFLTEQAEREMTDDQYVFIEQNAVLVGESQTHNGYTVTLESFLADKYDAYFKLKIEAPEGTQLCDSTWGTSGKGVRLIKKSDGRYNEGGGFYSIEGDSKSNYKLLHMDMQSALPEEAFEEFPDILPNHEPAEYLLQIDALQDIYLENGEITYKTVAEGPWEFEVDFRNCSMEEVEFMEEPMDYLMIADDHRLVPEKVPIKITSFRVCALRITMEFTYEDEKTRGRTDNFMPCTVVLKDGSTIEMEPGGFYYGATDLRTYIPIVLSEIDYIMLPDGTKLPMPE